MALTFPISASIGQTYQSGSSNTFEWTGTYWKIKNITTANFVGNTQYNIDSASFLSLIQNATNEQNISGFATTGSNTFYEQQIITGSTNSLLNLRGATDSPWALTMGNDTWVLDNNLYGNNSFQFGAWVWNSGKTSLGTEIDRPLEFYTNADYYNPNLILSSSGVSITKDLTISGSVFLSGSLIPNTGDGTFTSSFSLGSATNAWKDLYISHGSIIFVDAVTQETSSFSIAANPDLGQNTVQYTAAITASQYIGDGGGLFNLPSQTWWNTDKNFRVRNNELFTFPDNYVLENSTLYIEGSDETPEISFVSGSLIKKEGKIFIGGSLILKDSVITNDGQISVAGEVILIGDSQIIGTGTII